MLFALEGSAQSTLGTFAERQTKQLERRKELVSKQITAAKAAYEANPCDSLGKVVYELLKQSEAIDNALTTIAAQEQERIQKEQQEASKAEAEEQQTPPPAVDSVAVESVEKITPAAEQTASVEAESEAITPATSEDSQQPTPLNRFSAALSANALTEGEISLLIEHYKEAYKKASDALLAYNAATNLTAATESYNNYYAAVGTMDSLATEVATRSEALFKEKLETYISIAESVGANHIREKYKNIIQSVDSKHVGQMKNRCSNIDIAMYPYRLRSTIELEIEVAELLGCDSAAPLKESLANYNTSYTLFARLKTPNYAKASYKALVFDKKRVYVPINSLPKMEVPAEGEVYSIEVAGYTNLPNSTSVFHNATPLYRETRSDSRTYIYVGLYPTSKSTTDDIARMRKAGFKNPKVVAWRNGVRIDDFVQKGSNANTVVYYRIEINGVDAALSREALQAIRQTAPSKEISKFNAADGTLVYSVGNFKKEDEARGLAAAITDADASLSVTVVEFERKK